MSRKHLGTGSTDISQCFPHCPKNNNAYHTPTPFSNCLACPNTNGGAGRINQWGNCVCVEGYYWDRETFSCLSCPHYSTCPETSSSISQCEYKKGYTGAHTVESWTDWGGKQSIFIRDVLPALLSLTSLRLEDQSALIVRQV